MTDTIKKSKKRSNWQIKKGHDIHHLAHFESIIHPCLRELGLDPNRTDVIVSMRYEGESFHGYQILMEFQQYDRYGPQYQITHSHFGDHLLGLRGYPNPWMLEHLPTTEQIYLSFHGPA